MPQETKAHPFDAEAGPVGVVHENLEGWIPPIASDDEIRAALEKAFDYRGDITLTKKDGTVIEGYIFDRKTGRTLNDSLVRLLPKDSNPPLSTTPSVPSAEWSQPSRR